MDTLIQKSFLLDNKINNFPGDPSDISAKNNYCSQHVSRLWRSFCHILLLEVFISVGAS